MKKDLYIGGVLINTITYDTCEWTVIDGTGCGANTLTWDTSIITSFGPFTYYAGDTSVSVTHPTAISSDPTCSVSYRGLA